MASETLEEKKPEDTTEVEEKDEVKDEAKAEGKEGGEGEEVAEEKDGDQEMAEKEEGSHEEEEEEGSEEKVAENKAKGKGEPKRKRGRQPKPGKATSDASKEVSAPKKKQRGDSTSTEPTTPRDRPSRERKTVERYSEPSASRASGSKPISIEKGRGTQLKDIPNVAFKLSKRKPDDNLQTLHTILFGKKTKTHNLKKNIGQFSGYVWAENELEKQRSRIKERLDKCVKEKLLDFCDVLNIRSHKSSAKKEEVSATLLEFLESPHATTDSLLADSGKKGKKRKGKAVASKRTNSAEASIHKSVKKQKKSSQDGGKDESSAKNEDEEEADNLVEPSDSEEDSQDAEDVEMASKVESDQEEVKSEEEEEEEQEEEDEEEDEVKEKMPSGKKSSKKNVGVSGAKGHKSKSAKKDTPADSAKSPSKSTKKARLTPKKSGAGTDETSPPASISKASITKKKKAEKESEGPSVSAKEKGSKKRLSKGSSKVSPKEQVKEKGKTSKKSKTEPTVEEMHAVVVSILKEVDFNTATLSDIIRQLGKHFDMDLMHRKKEVKAILTDAINNMSEEEDEGEEADAEEEDAEKDEESDA